MTATYTDICGCAESTLKEFTVTSTLTLTRCNCTETGSAGPQLRSTEAVIPMTTVTRACQNCGINRIAVVTVPCEAAATTPEQLPLSSAPALAIQAPSPAPKEPSNEESNATVLSTQVRIATVIVVPQAVPVPGPTQSSNATLTATSSLLAATPSLVVVSDGVENRRMDRSKWGVSAVFGSFALLIWMFG